MFSLFGLAGVAVSAPIAANAALLNPGRSVTYLPGGGLLIEDEKFATGIELKDCQDVTVRNCIIERL
jgi:hypothetical protein